MTASGSESFGALLRRYRTDAGMTQEKLAERAGLSVRGISDLERGLNRTPYRATIERLIGALELRQEQGLALEAAINRRRGPAIPPLLHGSGTLPIPPTALIGRDRDEAAVVKLLRWEGRRLLTLTGPGGVGKTRLALQVAAAMAADFADGALFVPLAAIRDPTLVLPAIAARVGVRDLAGQTLQENITAHLQEREVLLLLDNFEQVLPAAPCIAEILAACPRVKALITSRAALRLRGEQIAEVGPLPGPAAVDGCTLEELLRYPAVALFLQCAQLVKPDFIFSEADARIAAHICLRVDGLPLAIELAAARLTILSPRALLQRLDRRLQVLTGGTREVEARQQTMRNTIAWSHDLLDVDEQAVFRCLAIFAGGCSVEAAEAVCVAPPTAQRDIFDILTTLVDQNILIVQHHDGVEPRFSMLETIKEFGRECLDVETATVQARHSTYFLRLTEQAAPELRGQNQGIWLARLDRDYDNLRAALACSIETGNTELGLRIAGGLWWFWYMRGYLSEGRQWLERLLHAEQAAGTTVPPDVRAAALRAAGILATEQGDYPRAIDLIEEALLLVRQRGDPQVEATLLNVLGNIAKYQTSYERAAALYGEALQLFRGLGDARSISVTLNNLGSLAKEQNDHAQAMALYDESLTMRRALGDQRGIAIVLSNIGTMAHGQGDFDRAVRTGEESVAILRDLGDKDLAAALDTLARAVLAQGDTQRAMGLYREGLSVSRAAGERQLMALCLEGLGHVASAQGNAEHGATLYGAGAALHEAIGALLSPAEEAHNANHFETARQTLGPAGFAAAWELGQAMPLDEAVGLALDGSP